MRVSHTAAVARRIGKEREREYEEWLAKVIAALHGVRGYDGLTVVTSSEPRGWVKTILIRFESKEALSDWEASPQRHSLAEQADRFSTHLYQTAPGMETFFSVPGAPATSAPPRWKMCILTVPMVYALLNGVLVILMRLMPGMASWPAAMRMMAVIPIMTVLLTYAGLPALSRLFAPWLFSHAVAPATQTFKPTNS
jgi:antibiotic biosynthesis monooxygenase (ABM) superfamily enzyme